MSRKCISDISHSSDIAHNGFNEYLDLYKAMDIIYLFILLSTYHI